MTPKIMSWISTAAEDLSHLMNLKEDFDKETTVEFIEQNIDFKSANAWTLIFAIAIASAGLEVNSTAVIIGAMLISPLMGPIVGSGYALGVNNYPLLKKSLRNLAFAAIISVITSTLFFVISPMAIEQSELLARTQPTFFDVIIAFFGGAAGIVALSRRQKGNAIPGVAIATALMPPLCTAGFGLATGQFTYFLGALYLFVINCVFIFVSTYIFVRYLDFEKFSFSTKAEEKKKTRWISITAFLVVIPSIFIAWFLQQEGSFKLTATSFIEKELKFEKTFILSKEIHFDFKKPVIKITTIGEQLNEIAVEKIKSKLIGYNLKPEQLIITHTELTDNSLKEKTQELQSDLSIKESQLSYYSNKVKLWTRVNSELGIVFPDLQYTHTKLESDDTVYLMWKKRAAKAEKAKAEELLKTRLQKEDLKIVHSLITD